MGEEKKSESPSEENFDESELEDIMSEIESLEREVVKESSQSTMPKESQGPQASAPIDEEVEQTEQAPDSEVESTEDFAKDEHEDEDDEEGPAIEFDESELAALEADCAFEESDTGPEQSGQDNVVDFKKSSHQTSQNSSESSSPVQVTAAGDMNLELNFTVGTEQALLSIEQGRGLSVEMEGVSLYIDSERGCCISLPGGVEFSVPLNSGTTGQQKKTG